MSSLNIPFNKLKTSTLRKNYVNNLNEFKFKKANYDSVDAISG